MNSTDRLKDNARQIFASALEAANPQKAVSSSLHLEGNSLRLADKSYNLDDYKKILVSGVGNYSVHMSQAVEKILGERLHRGMVLTRYTLGFTLEKVETTEAGFPIPDQSGVTGTRKLKAFLEEAGEDTLLILLISKGAPSLSTVPVEGINLAEKLKTTSLLRKSGADVRELYTVQKHLSTSKGGQIAKWGYPATMPTLILSDLLEDDLSLICSGLTVPDETTYEEAREVLQKYELIDRLPKTVLEHIDAGIKGLRDETPKPGDKIFDKVDNVIVASNSIALKSAQETAKTLGYNSTIFPAFLQGEAKEMGTKLSELVKQVKTAGKPVSPPACLIFGGEATVTKKGRGRGGANQEVALGTAIELAGIENFLLLQSSTSGTDGDSDVSGAIVDGGTTERGKKLGLDPQAHLANNDSYNFFRQTGETFVTGPTDTDVMDIGIILVES
ncbi:MAG: DUF4147 domain-containing protein [Candidatus Zixiibacteriota bacterium]|nr:MAG: DUF4147 domain-containing protein [candidate division Zixibacteria bacterium]